MRAETVIMALKERRRAMEEAAFSQMSQSHDEYLRKQGIWQGLGEAINIITDEAQKEALNDG